MTLASALAMPARMSRSSLLSKTGGMPPFQICRNGFEQLAVISRSFELEPRVGRQREVGILDRRGHLDVHRDDHLDVRVDVLDHAVGPLGVVDQVDVV